MADQNKSEEKAKNAAINEAVKTVAIGAVCTAVFGSPIGLGLTAYYAIKYARQAYRDPKHWS